MTAKEVLRSKVKEAWEAWSTPLIEKHQDPERVGTPRGAPVGLSKKKYRAALAQVLHNRSKLFTLSGLEEISGVSSIQNRVWRTEPEFRKAVEKAKEDFVDYLSNEAMESWHDELRLDLLLYLLSMQEDGLIKLFFKWNKEARQILDKIEIDRNAMANYEYLLDNMSFFVIFMRKFIEVHSADEKARVKNVIMRDLWPYIHKVSNFIIEIIGNRETQDDVKKVGKKILNVIMLANWDAM